MYRETNPVLKSSKLLYMYRGISFFAVPVWQIGVGEVFLDIAQ